MALEFKNFIKSKRFAIIIYIMVAWVGFGVLGIIYGADMGQFAAYFAALSPFIIGYVYGETKRPSGKNYICKCQKS
jgi:membrane associated rhomboid family serine protease